MKLKTQSRGSSFIGWLIALISFAGSFVSFRVIPITLESSSMDLTSPDVIKSQKSNSIYHFKLQKAVKM